MGGTGGSGGLDGLLTLDVLPPDATVFVDVLNGVPTPGAQDYQAIGHFRDDSMRDLTTLVHWAVDDPIASFPTGSHLVAGTAQGGQTHVHATAASSDGASALKVIIRGSTVAPGAPPDSAGHFGGASDPGRAATVVYPNDGVLLPPNLGTIEFQWQPAPGTDLFDLYLHSDFLDLHVYTTTNKYTPTAPEWTWLAETHRGGTVTYTVRATALAGGGVGVAPERRALFSETEVKGGLYYWSATSPDTEGIWRFDFGAVGAMPEKYYAQNDPGPANAGHCVACHAISHDGTRIALTFDGGDGPAGLLDVATRNPMVPYGQGVHSNFTTFSPDATRVVTTFHGTLTLREATSYAPIGDVPTGGRASHPDWSPDGAKLVYALAAAGMQNSDWTIQGASIEIIDYNGGAWGTPRTVVQSVGENNYYPQFSPDGNWIVFNRAFGDPTGLHAYNNPTAEVWVVKADGTVPPVKLTAAHDQPAMTDSWPRWSPFSQTYGPPATRGPLMWVTVSSKRVYGLELPAGTRPQLWMFAFAPNRLAASQDPSYPAFWLPFQNLSTNNHIAQWTTRIIPVGRMD
ncbi:MAG TPA: hypothetical protein VKN99_17170 [Polyangia bacterium]|nr:hypothetical protein [Polyangia bacterium]